KKSNVALFGVLPFALAVAVFTLTRPADEAVTAESVAVHPTEKHVSQAVSFRSEWQRIREEYQLDVPQDASADNVRPAVRELALPQSTQTDSQAMAAPQALEETPASGPDG